MIVIGLCERHLVFKTEADFMEMLSNLDNV